MDIEMEGDISVTIHFEGQEARCTVSNTVRESGLICLDEVLAKTVHHFCEHYDHQARRVLLSASGHLPEPYHFNRIINFLEHKVPRGPHIEDAIRIVVDVDRLYERVENPDPELKNHIVSTLKNLISLGALMGNFPEWISESDLERL